MLVSHAEDLDPILQVLGAEDGLLEVREDGREHKWSHSTERRDYEGLPFYMVTQMAGVDPEVRWGNQYINSAPID